MMGKETTFIKTIDVIKTMKRLLFFAVIAVFMVSFVLAIEPHQQNTNYTYSETVANSDQCNLTSITYPDGTTRDLDIEMSKLGFRFSSNITSGNFSQIGDTCWSIICYDADADPQFIDGVKCLEVSPSGFSGTLGFYILIFLISAGIIVLGFYQNDGWLSILGSFGLYFIGLYILFFGVVGIKDLVYTWALGIIVLMSAAYISVRSAIEMIN